MSTGVAHYDPTGLVYLNNRYHDPTLGTFISVDPVVTTTFESYTYASANPITLSDATGLCPMNSAAAAECAKQWCDARTDQCRPPTLPPLPPSTPDTYPNQPPTSVPGSSPKTGTASALLGESPGEGYSIVCGPPSASLGPSATGGPCGWMKDLPGFFEALGDALDDMNCDWQCWLATGTTAAFAFGTASLACVGSAIGTAGSTSAVACTVSYSAAAGATNLVFETTSTEGQLGPGDVVCTFTLGSSSPVVNAGTAGAGGALGAAAREAGSVAAGAVKNVVQDALAGAALGGICD